MNDKSELRIYKQNHKILMKQYKRVIAIIESESPSKRYFFIIDEIKKHQGTKYMLGFRMQKLINEGACLEGNLAELDKKHRKKVDRAWDERVDIEIDLSMVNSRISGLERNK